MNRHQHKTSKTPASLNPLTQDHKAQGVRHLWYTFLLLSGLSGCISIELSPPPVSPYYDFRSPSHFSMSNVSPAPSPDNTRKRSYYKTTYHSALELRFKPMTQDPLRAGSVFAGVIVPVGAITVVTPSLHLESALRERLLQKSTQIISTKRMEAPEIAIDNLSLTVWDLLITRKITCDLRSSITPPGTENKHHRRKFEVYYSTYSTYAFKKELSFHLRECFDLLARRIIDGIKPKNYMKSYH